MDNSSQNNPNQQDQPDTSFYYQPSSLKEQKEALGSLAKEKEVIHEYKEPEPSKEVEPWIEKVEKKEIKLPQPIYDQSGQVILDNIVPQKPKITLPLDKLGIQKGLKYKVQDSLRWLAEWCLRVIKMGRWRVVYK